MNEKIVLVSCPREGNECKEHRFIINRDFYESQNYFLNKDYPKSILALKTAFQRTTELQETSCSNCAEMFRNTITQSMELLYNDLHYMSKGFFGKRRFHYSLQLADLTLKEMKRKAESDSAEIAS
jgi:hypothetical protein